MTSFDISQSSFQSDWLPVIIALFIFFFVCSIFFSVIFLNGSKLRNIGVPRQALTFQSHVALCIAGILVYFLAMPIIFVWTIVTKLAQILRVLMYMQKWQPSKALADDPLAFEGPVWNPLWFWDKVFGAIVLFAFNHGTVAIKNEGSPLPGPGGPAS